jgi:hypothetical protein
MTNFPHFRREFDGWGDCHLDIELNEPADASDIVETACHADRDFYSVPLDEALASF